MTADRQGGLSWLCALTVETDDEFLGTLELEASRHRRQGRKEQGQAIRPERRQSVVAKSPDAPTTRSKGSGKGATGAAAESPFGVVDVERDPFDDLLSLSDDPAGAEATDDNQMMGNKRPGTATAPVAKKPKQPKMELPSGATVVSNEGGGNCLPAAVAQALTSHNGKLVSHRGVRRAMTHWMREQARHLQPLWDGRDTNDQPCHLSFSDYLSAVEAVGSWCGNLEVYALSRGLPANLLILDFDSETTIKFASQADSDPFVVLKYSGRHYEWIQCSPEALVDIWCHAAVGTTTGGRGGGFMQIDSASETSGPQARPSRMVIAPASDAGSRTTRGGRTQRVVIDAASSTGSLRASSTRHARDPCAAASSSSATGGHMVLDEASTDGLMQIPPASEASGSSTKRRRGGCLSAAEVRHLRRDAPRSSVHSWSKKPASSTATDQDLDGCFDAAEAPPPPKTPARDRIVTFQCDLCPFRIQGPHRLVATRKHKHNVRYHEGQGNHPRSAPYLIGPMRSISGAVGWKCPLCKKGASAAPWGELSETTRQRQKAMHRATTHPHVTKKNWAKLCKRVSAKTSLKRGLRRSQLLTIVSSQGSGAR